MQVGLLGINADIMFLAPFWQNREWRSYAFAPGEGDTALIEDEESVKRRKDLDES